MARGPRRSRGRQRIQMTRMTNESNLAVTFTKRRFTVFKSASELCALTGAEIALITFSPGNKACSFGSPDVHSVIDRYLNNGPQVDCNPLEKLQHMLDSESLNEEMMNLEKVLEKEKERAKVLNQRMKEREGKYWWDAPVQSLDLDHLQELQKNMVNLFHKIDKQIKDRVGQNQENNKATAGFVVPQNGEGTLPLNFSGGISVGGATSSTMPQGISVMDYLAYQPTNFGVFQQSFAGPSAIQSDVFINSDSLSNQMDISTMGLLNSMNQMNISNMEATGSNQIAISTMEATGSNQMAVPTWAGGSSNQMVAPTVAASGSNQMAFPTGAGSSNQMTFPTGAGGSSNQMVASAMAASGSNQMITFDNASQEDSATVGVLQQAGPSRIDVDPQSILADLEFPYGVNPYEFEDWLKRFLD